MKTRNFTGWLVASAISALGLMTGGATSVSAQIDFDPDSIFAIDLFDFAGGDGSASTTTVFAPVTLPSTSSAFSTRQLTLEIDENPDGNLLRALIGNSDSDLLSISAGATVSGSVILDYTNPFGGFADITAGGDNDTIGILIPFSDLVTEIEITLADGSGNADTQSFDTLENIGTVLPAQFVGLDLDDFVGVDLADITEATLRANLQPAADLDVDFFGTVSTGSLTGNDTVPEPTSMLALSLLSLGAIATKKAAQQRQRSS